MAKNGKKGNNNAVLNIPVQFGGVSIGKSTARLGCAVDRQSLNLVAADEAFCGHRLTGTVRLGGEDGQPMLDGMDDLEHEVAGTFDCKRIGVSAESISFGLTFSLADVEVGELAKLSKGAGRLLVESIAELPADAHDEEDDEEFIPAVDGGAWRDVELSTLFDGAKLKSLKKAGLKTVGDLSDFTASDKRLIDLEGIGEGKAAEIEDTMLKFWEANPDMAEAAGV